MKMASFAKLDFIRHVEPCDHKNVHDENFSIVCTFIHCTRLAVAEEYLDDFRVLMYDVPLIQEFFLDMDGTSMGEIDFVAAMEMIWSEIPSNIRSGELSARLSESIAWELIMQQPENTIFEDRCQYHVSNMLSKTSKVHSFRAYFLLRETIIISRKFMSKPEWRTVRDADSIWDAIDKLVANEANDSEVISELQRLSEWFTQNSHKKLKPELSDATLYAKHEESEGLKRRIAELKSQIDQAQRKLDELSGTMSNYNPALSEAEEERDTIFESLLAKVGIDFNTLAQIQDVQDVHDSVRKVMEQLCHKLPLGYVGVLQYCETVGRTIVRKRIEAVNLLCTDAADPSSYVAVMVTILGQRGVCELVKDLGYSRERLFSNQIQILAGKHKVPLVSVDNHKDKMDTVNYILNSVGESERNDFVEAMASVVKAGSLMELLMHEKLEWRWDVDELDGFDSLSRDGCNDVVLFPSLVECDAGGDGVLRRLRKVVRDRVAIIADALENQFSGHTENPLRIIDCCSGGGGPAPAVAELLAQKRPIQMVLSDLFPNIPAFKRIADETQVVSYCAEPVSALDIPAEFSRHIRTMFGSFHHFEKADAIAILQDCVKKRCAIVIVEGTERSLMSIVFTSLALPIVGLVLAIQHMTRPFWDVAGQLLVVPIMVVDGAVSCLRTYTESEYVDLVDAIPGARESHDWTYARRNILALQDTRMAQWHWMLREVAQRIDSFVAVTMFVGVPKAGIS
ncbi:hypothetical protein HDU83_004630 [Entophlyctis luteolus]|nr:hypothetical protein HDU83_004630 [Entophlyctis luteolus]